jgi:hypothetical protein
VSGHQHDQRSSGYVAHQDQRVEHQGMDVKDCPVGSIDVIRTPQVAHVCMPRKASQTTR